MTRPFIIYALPRSRTVWLSKLLTYGGWTCLHDPLAHMRLSGVAAYLKSPNIGIADTGLVQYWREMKGLVPEARIITIRRDVLDVRGSLMKHGLDYPIAHLYHQLEELEKQCPDVISIPYHLLARRDVCKKLMRECLGDCDPEWVHGKMLANIQMDIEKLRSQIPVL